MAKLLAALLIIHGLIHGLGFVKGLGLARVAQLQRDISAPAGVLWLVAGVLFLGAAVALWIAPRVWWAPALVAVVVSQALIVSVWSDARFGTLANVLILLPAIVAALSQAPWSDRARADAAVAHGEARALTTTAAVGAADVAHLPAPVRRYLDYVGVVGRPVATRVHARFRGQIRSSPQADWMDFQADQHNFLSPRARVFFLTASKLGLPFTAYHHYADGHATMEVRALSLAKLVDARGPEMDQSETVTFLNDLCILLPGGLLSRDLEWKELDPTRVQVTLRHAGQVVRATLEFDAATGALTNFLSDDRYQSADGRTYTKYRWSTPVRDYREVEGRRVAAYGEATWAMPGGPLTYGRFELIDITWEAPSSVGDADAAAGQRQVPGASSILTK